MTGSKALIAGWFSFDEMGATAGDLMVCDVVCSWLEEGSVPFDVATAGPFKGGVNWKQVEPGDYSHVVFVCGPLGNGWPVTDFFARFHQCSLVGVNLSMLQSLEEWNPFDLLLERDSDRTTRPDLSLSSERRKVPVVGVAFVPDQAIPGAMNKRANAAIEDFLSRTEAAVVRVDTRLDVANESKLRTPAEIESLLAAMDVIATTRLHATVLGLKNGVPVIPVDPIAGGHKLTRQVKHLGWPVILDVGQVAEQQLEEAFAWCLSSEARDKALECARAAASQIDETKAEFQSFFGKAESSGV